MASSGTQIIWSSTNGGSSIDEPVDDGTGTNTTTLPAQTIFVRQTGTVNITNCKLYLRKFLGDTTDGSTYSGDATPLTDFNELITWGDATQASGYGGLQINMNATAGFPLTSWPSFSNKTSADGFGFTIRTGVGDSSTNGIVLPTVTGASSSGVIVPGNPNVRFQLRIVVPQTASVVGVRLFETVLSFT